MPTLTERDRRHRLTNQAMEAAHLDALVVAGVAEAARRGYIRYLADWHLWGGAALLVFPCGREPTLILGSQSQVFWAAQIGWIADVDSSAPRPLTDLALDRLRRIPNLRRVGVVGFEQAIGAGELAALAAGLPGVELVSATALLGNLMVDKSAEERVLMGETAQIVADSIRAFGRALQPGITERQAIGVAHRFLREHGALDGIAHINTEYAEPFIRPPTERRIERNDIIKISFEFAGPSGYWIELSAIFSFVEPPERLRRHFETTVLACANAAAAMVPGTPARALAEVVEQTYADAGWEIAERAIWDVHGIGLNVIEPPQSTPHDETPLRDGMVLSLHPGLLVRPDRWGLYLQDNYTVTPNGGVRMSDLDLVWNVVG